MATSNGNHLPRNFAGLNEAEERKLINAGIIVAKTAALDYRFKQRMTESKTYEIRDERDNVVAYKKDGGELLFAGEAEAPRSYGGGRQPFTKRYW